MAQLIHKKDQIPQYISNQGTVYTKSCPEPQKEECPNHDSNTKCFTYNHVWQGLWHSQSCSCDVPKVISSSNNEDGTKSIPKSATKS